MALHTSAPTLKPLTAEVINIDHHISMQCSHCRYHLTPTTPKNPYVNHVSNLAVPSRHLVSSYATYVLARKLRLNTAQRTQTTAAN